MPAHFFDPFFYIETGERRAAVLDVLEETKLAAARIEQLDPFALGVRELARRGVPKPTRDAEIARRACEALGVTGAVVGRDFPAILADYLREHGIEVTVDVEAFFQRRRRKSRAQMDGVRRASAAADAAMAVAARLIRELPAGLTSEDVRTAMRQVCDQRSAVLGGGIVGHGAQTALGHEPGHGVIERGEPVLVDIGPFDTETHCYADMSRTFVAGGGSPDAELAEYWRLSKESLERVVAAIRPGVRGSDVYAVSCEPFEAAGQPTNRTATAMESLRSGYNHDLGHGIGVEVHERPSMGIFGDELQVGDVLAVEPGCYREGYGGCRLEDVLIVTEDGCEVVNAFPYDL